MDVRVRRPNRGQTFDEVGFDPDTTQREHFVPKHLTEAEWAAGAASAGWTCEPDGWAQSATGLRARFVVDEVVAAVQAEQLPELYRLCQAIRTATGTYCDVYRLGGRPVDDDRHDFGYRPERGPDGVLYLPHVPGLRFSLAGQYFELTDDDVRGLAVCPEIEVLEQRVPNGTSRPTLRWRGHPSGEPREAVLEDGELTFHDADAFVIRWLVALAEDVGLFAKDDRDVPWVPCDSPPGVHWHVFSDDGSGHHSFRELLIERGQTRARFLSREDVRARCPRDPEPKRPKSLWDRVFGR